MTFFAQNSCSCGECGGSPAFMEYMTAYQKRKGFEEIGSTASSRQTRTLLLRDFREGSSTELLSYSYTLPCNALPLIEYGTSNRLVFIKNLNPNNVLKSLGGGVMGSEGKRKELDWKEGDVFYVKKDRKLSGFINCLRRSPSKKPKSSSGSEDPTEDKDQDVNIIVVKQKLVAEAEAEAEAEVANVEGEPDTRAGIIKIFSKIKNKATTSKLSGPDLETFLKYINL